MTPKAIHIAYVIGNSLRLYMADNPRNKSAQLNIRIKPEMKAAADRAAADDQRSLTSLVEKLLSDYLKQKGYLPK